MAQDFKHRALLQFIRKVVEVPAGYSKEDLMIFRSIASRDFPAFVPVMDDYLKLAESADTDSKPTKAGSRPRPAALEDAAPMHLFDMLRDKSYSRPTRIYLSLRVGSYQE